MTACIIVLGWDTSTRLPDTLFDSLSAYGGNLICKCNPCVHTKRVTFPEGPPGSYTVNALDFAEVKPAETYVVTVDSNATDTWLQDHASALVGKTVYVVDPGVT